MDFDSALLVAPFDEKVKEKVDNLIKGIKNITINEPTELA